MRYAIISDIHANLEALQATITDLENQDVQQIICLGDIVGYYPNPNECTELCRARGFTCLRGNHDDAAVGNCGIEDFNPIAQAALRWTARNLKEVNKKWLLQLPEQFLDDHFLAVHGSPWDPYAYIFSAGSASRAFLTLKSHYSQVNLCFFGHTHQRALYYTDEGSIHKTEGENKYRLGKTGRYLINPGSIGQARDGKPGASYLIYDAERTEIEFRHVTYNLNLTQQKVVAAGLPQMLAERLSLGY
ncbi:MAG: metallophosphoesterase family protein [Bacillota bacterium]|nr:metallophosphoesterase family protein [Bacillota bacterium]